MMRKILYALIMGAMLAGASSCNYQDQIDGLTVRVEALESAVAQLEKAYSVGKIITKTETFAEGEGGYIITFSDGSKITLNNGKNGNDGQNGADGANGADGLPGADGADGADGKDGADGVTPLLKIDTDGYWTVSYDGGATYTRILDENGLPIPARGRDGEAGSTGDTGEAGKDGLCVRVVVEDGHYVFQIYSPSDPDTVIESVPTLYVTEPGSVLQSIVRDDSTGVITITMADGSEFKFNLDVCYPTGIVILTDEVSLGSMSEGSFIFRVNPSNAYVSTKLDGYTPSLELDHISDNTRAGYVTAPENYHLERIEQCYDDNGNLLEGQYRGYIRDNGVGPGYDETVMVVLNTKDGNGNPIQVSSTKMRVVCGTGNEIFSVSFMGSTAENIGNDVLELKIPRGIDLKQVSLEIQSNAYIIREYGKEQTPGEKLYFDFSRPVKIEAVSGSGESRVYTVVPYFSNLPVVFVNSPTEINTREEWTKECDIIISHAGKNNAEFSEVQIKGRGNSSWGFPKRSYSVKLNKKSEVLGMAKHKRWVFSANWLDRTLLRNDVTYEIGRRMQALEWTPNGEFVDVIWNGKFRGNYSLCEQIKIDSNRVPITEMTSADEDAESITGGYLIEMDVSYDEVNKFKSTYRSLPVMIKDPDEDVLTEKQFKYIKNYILDVERVLYGSNRNQDISNYLDLASYADWLLVNELVGNTECYWPKSVYMYKDRGDVMKAGPLWDYDWGTFVPGRDTWLDTSFVWYGGLMQRADFKQCLKERWKLHRDALATIPDYIDQRSAELEESWNINSVMWPITNPANGDENMTQKLAAERMKKAYMERYNFIDGAIDKL